MDLERKVAETIEREHMIERGGHVVAAISGGADSACLLRVLGGLSASRNFTLEALHVHHGLRGQEADRDEAFVRELCGELGVPLTVRHERVRSTRRTTACPRRRRGGCSATGSEGDCRSPQRGAGGLAPRRSSPPPTTGTTARRPFSTTCSAAAG